MKVETLVFDDPSRVYLKNSTNEDHPFMDNDNVERVAIALQAYEVELRAQIAREIESLADAETKRLKAVKPGQLNDMLQNWVDGIREGAKVARGLR